MRKILAIAILGIIGVLNQVPTLNAQSPNAGKFQVYGGYTFQRSYGYENAFSLTSGGSGSGNEAVYRAPEASGSSNDEFAPFNSNGGQFAFTYFPLKHFGIAYQATFAGSGDRSIESSSVTQNIGTQSHLFGPIVRFGIKGSRISLFAQELAGVMHNTFKSSSASWAFCESSSGTAISNCSTNNLGWVTGGGVDYRITPHFSIRPAQLEYWSEQIPIKDLIGEEAFSAKFGVNGLRYSAGAVVNF